MKSKTAGAAYKAARGNLLAMLVLTAVNTLLALTGSDRYYLFTDFAAYIWAVFARGFYDFTGEAKWLVLGAAGAVLVMAVYFLCWLLSKKRRGWLTAALVLFSVDTAALVAGLVTAFEASSILDVVFHGLLLWYLAMGVRRGREAMEEPEGQRETPEPLPQNTEFYDASMGERPNSPSLGQPAEGKHRTLLTAAYGRDRGPPQLWPDGADRGRKGLRTAGGRRGNRLYHPRPGERSRCGNGVHSHRQAAAAGGRPGHCPEAAPVLSPA